MSLQRLVVICCIMFTSPMISYAKQDNRKHHDKYSRIQNIKGGRETFEDYESTPRIKKFNIEASPQNLLGDSMQIKMKGADGIDGKDGPDGDAGPLGPAGPPGVPGSKGDAGICQPSECDYLNIMPMVARVTTLERYATEGGSGMSGGVEEAPAAVAGEGAATATGLGGGAGFGGGGGVGSPGGGSGGGGGGGGADSATSTETTSPSVPVPPSTPDSPSKSSTTSGGGGGGSAGSMGSAAGAGSGVGGGTSSSKREIKGKETFNLFHQLNDGAIKGNEVNTIKRSTLPKHPDTITSDYWKKFDLKTKNGVPVDEE